MEKEFLTIREITALAKQAGQKSDTMKEWKMQARRRGWKTMGPGVYRVVDGEPVYHVSVLGERLRKLVRPPKPDAEAMKIRRAQDMLAARQIILTAIEARAESAGRSWREAAQEFVATVDAESQCKVPVCARHIAGFDLPYTIIREAKGWVPKDGVWRVSLRLLYTWRSASLGGNSAQAKPATTGAAGSLEKGFRAAAEFLWSSPDVVLELMVARDEARFVEIMRRRGYQVERVQTGPVQSGS